MEAVTEKVVDEEDVYKEMETLEDPQQAEPENSVEPTSAPEKPALQKADWFAAVANNLPAILRPGGAVRQPPLAPDPAACSSSSADTGLNKSESLVMDTDTGTLLPNLYYQSRAARDATFNDSACDISNTNNLGSNVGGGRFQG